MPPFSSITLYIASRGIFILFYFVIFVQAVLVFCTSHLSQQMFFIDNVEKKEWTIIFSLHSSWGGAQRAGFFWSALPMDSSSTH